MIISEIKLNNSKYKPYLKNLPVRTQVIKVRCDNCGKEYNSSYIYYENGIKNYGKDLCQSCKQIEQYKQGKREKQKKHIGFYATNYQKGKTYEEMYNEQKIQKLKEILSIKSSGKNNPNYGGKYSKCESCKAKKGETYEIRFGKEKANKMKKNLSNKFSGSKNNMYGKPSPQGSGNGWSGWYKGWFFRSLLELSYMINVIEKNGWKWENAESKKYKIPYTVDDKKRRLCMTRLAKIEQKIFQI